jgi:hypothetical protein
VILVTMNEVAKWAMSNGLSPLEAVEYWDERAAIRQHDGGQSQAEAESNAFADLERAFANGWFTTGPVRS